MIDLESAELVASESYVNATEETRYGDSGWQETWTDDIGLLYRNAVRDLGRCIGHVYADFGDKTYAVGWVFQRREEYEGRWNSQKGKTYLREVWVSLGVKTEAGDVFAFDVKHRKPVPLPNAA